MKTLTYITLKTLALIVWLGAATANAAPLFTEQFAYTTGDTLGSNGWTLVPTSGGASTLVVANNLSLSGFAASSGNATQLRPNGQDWFRSYTTQSYTNNSTESLYYSFLLRVDNLGLLNTTGGFFGGLAAGNGTSGGAMVGMRLSGLGFQLGVAKRDSTALSFDSTVYSTGSTILVVGAYNLVSGSVQNDTASLWINPGSLGAGSAPSATLSVSTTGINNDTQSFSSFRWSPQGNATSTLIPGSLIVDELRVGNSWADVTPVPEPSTFALVLISLVGGAFLIRRCRRSIA